MEGWFSGGMDLLIFDRMRKIFFLLFFSGALMLASQTRDAAGRAAPADTIFTWSHMFYTETGRSFFNFSFKPTAFTFYLFDRWGSLLAHSEDPQFIIDDVLIDKKNRLPGGIYVFKVTFTDESGIKRKYIDKISYMGFYCGG